MKRILQQHDGFTLIEAITALVILTVGIFGFFAITISSIGTNTRANTTTLASAQVADQIERIRQSSYTTLADGNRIDPQTGYNITWTVTNNSPIVNAKRVVVQIIVPNNGPTVTFDYVRHDDGT